MKTLYQISKAARTIHHHHHHHHLRLRHYSSVGAVDRFSGRRSHKRHSQRAKVTPPIRWSKRVNPERLFEMIDQHQNVDLCLQIFNYAGKHHKGFKHNYKTYSLIIHKLCRARAFEPIETLLSELIASGIKCTEDLLIDVLRNYGLAGRPEDALSIFMRTQDFGVKKSLRSFNTLLYVLIVNKKYELVLSLFKDSQRKFNIVPDECTFNNLLKALCDKGDTEAALKVLDEMPAMGMLPNGTSYFTIFRGYVSKGDMDGAAKMFDLILRRGWAPDAISYTMLMDGFCKLGRFDDAVRIMDAMKANKVAPNGVTYSVMIEAFCKEKKPCEALYLLDGMLQKKYVPNSALCCKLIDALCEQGKVEDACDLRKKLLTKNVDPDKAITSTLIHWLCKKGKVWEARKLFDEFEKSPIPSVSTYNSLIGGMCEAGELCEAGRLWDDMEIKGRSPNRYTYNLLLVGFCKVGSAKEGVKFLRDMFRKGFKPLKSTYSVLLTELCELGDEAEVTKVIAMDKTGHMIDSDVWQLLVAKFGSNITTKRVTAVDSIKVNSAS